MPRLIERARHYGRAVAIAVGVSLGQIGPTSGGSRRPTHAVVRVIDQTDADFSELERVDDLILTGEVPVDEAPASARSRLARLN